MKAGESGTDDQDVGHGGACRGKVSVAGQQTHHRLPDGWARTVTWPMREGCIVETIAPGHA
jgi:hypothetical protein